MMMRNASLVLLLRHIIVVVMVVVVVASARAVSGQQRQRRKEQEQIFFVQNDAPPPNDEASYSAQCRIAPTIALNEPVTITFMNGSIVWVENDNDDNDDDNDDDSSSSTITSEQQQQPQKHPQQGAVLMCSRESIDIYYDGVGTNKNVWYTLIGNGRQVLTASTCAGTVAASITVLQDTCPTLQCNIWIRDECPTTQRCVDTAMTTTVPPPESSSSSSSTSYSSASNPPCPFGSTELSWIGEMNRTYYIQVWQYYDPLGGIRPFSNSPSPFIQQTCHGGTTTLTVSESIIPTNYNSCPHAQSLDITNTNNGTSTSTLVVTATKNGNSINNGTQQHFHIVQNCSSDNALKTGIGYNDDSPGLWYSLMGNGKVWYIETCNGILLSMFTGPSCQQLSCFNDFVITTTTTNDDDGGDQHNKQCSRMTFQTTNATRYYIHAWGPGILHPTFRLDAHQEEEQTNITRTSATNNNNHCTNATRFVADGIPKTLSFDPAIHSSLRPDQLFVDVTPTLWYQLNGTTGRRFTVQVCPPPSESPNVFIGTCTDAMDRTYDDLLEPTLWSNENCMAFRFQSNNASQQYLFGFRNTLNHGTTYNVTLWEENLHVLPLYSTSCEHAIGPIPYNTSSTTTGQFVDATTGGSGGATLMKNLYFYAIPPPKGKFLRGRICRRLTTNSTNDFHVALIVTTLNKCQSTITSPVTEDAGKLVGPIDDNGCRTISWRNDDPLPLLIVVSAVDTAEIGITIWQESSSILPLNDKPPVSYRSQDNTTRNYPRISVGTSVFGSTVHAHPDLPPYGGCKYDAKVNQPDVWYLVQGDGRELEACVVRGNTTNTSSSFGGGTLAVVTELIHGDVIYIGCLPNVEYGTVTNCPISVRWKTSNNTIYSLLVQTTEPNAFELSLWNVSDFPANSNNEEWQCMAPQPPSPTSGTVSPNNFSLYSSSVAPVSTPTAIPPNADPGEISFSTPSRTTSIASSSGVVLDRNFGSYDKLVAFTALMHSLFIWIIS